MLKVPPDSFEILLGSTPVIVNPAAGGGGFWVSVGAGFAVGGGVLVEVSEGVIVMSMVDARVGFKRYSAPEADRGCTNQDPMPSVKRIVGSHKALYMVVLL